MRWPDEFDWSDYDDDCEDAVEFKRRCRESIGVRNKELGERGEQAAARYLRLMGYEILERNFVCPAGEADIIARDGDYLVFVEVKTRTHIEKGMPEEAVDAKKRARYEKIACWFLADFEETDIPLRFDVISLVVVGEDRAMLRHHVNAFGQGCCL